jgi:hypothetical protein
VVHRKERRQAERGYPGKWLKTPLGWARAQLIFEKISEPPVYGSLLEAMCLLVQRHRQTAQLLETRAQVQAAVNKDGASDAYQALVAHLQRVEKEDETKKMKERLEELKQIKEIRFKPLTTTERKLNLPTTTADAVRAAGRLSEQIRPVRATRPARARERRKTR